MTFNPHDDYSDIELTPEDYAILEIIATHLESTGDHVFAKTVRKILRAKDLDDYAEITWRKLNE